MGVFRGYKYWNLIAVIFFALIISLGMLKVEINEVNKRTEIIQTEGKVVECITVKNTTIFSLVGLDDSLEYKTIIEVDNGILESKNKEIYYLCKDKINSNIDLKIETFNGKARKITEVLNKGGNTKDGSGGY